ncbi:hypothetical protein DEQ92_20665 [Haloferax sp. Atlit-6N]|uniref:glycosyltransferase family 2 protein n=1 Tax=Haloferax sp. Atlit-6N TaxID=2077205 RepID=UPI000E271FBC|nr:glycosyltransferase family 2 protein [Haloferax sp. Atlit-6N]REA00153.1 hypothetical protein DEQ92_20665 [Haloferax sp. Atlit-6N]
MGEDSEVTACLIINWNNYNDTAECINMVESIDKEHLEVIVVDNGSDDGSGKRIEKNFNDIEMVFAEKNGGFGSAVNIGAKCAIDLGADYLWLLNNDIILPEDFQLRPLINEVDSSTGLVTPLIYHDEDREKIWFSKGNINKKTGETSHEWYSSLISILKSKFGSSPNFKSAYIQNDYIPFACAILSLDVYEQVGHYPENYFLYYGDAEYCRRIRKSGFEIKTKTDQWVEHKVSSSSGGSLTPIPSYYTARNKWIFAKQLGTSNRFYSHFIYWFTTRLLHRLIHLEIQGARALVQGTIDGFKGEEYRGRYP